MDNTSPTVNLRDAQQLYRLYDADGTLLYVGISYSAIARFAGHKADKPWIGDVARIDIEHHDVTRREMLNIERRIILTEKPLHNVTHNGLTLMPHVVADDVYLFVYEYDNGARSTVPLYVHHRFARDVYGLAADDGEWTLRDLRRLATHRGYVQRWHLAGYLGAWKMPRYVDAPDYPDDFFYRAANELWSQPTTTRIIMDAFVKSWVPLNCDGEPANVLTIREASRLCRIPRTSIDVACASGQLPYRTINGVTRVTFDDLRNVTHLWMSK
jgi:hypothetical protein